MYISKFRYKVGQFNTYLLAIEMSLFRYFVKCCLLFKYYLLLLLLLLLLFILFIIIIIIIILR